MTGAWLRGCRSLTITPVHDSDSQFGGDTPRKLYIQCQFMETAFAKVGLIAAGIMLALESLIGCVAALGIGFEPAPVLLGLALSMGLPVYLLSLRSLRWAAIGLWVLFLYRWAVLCCLNRPIQLVNPVRGWAFLLPISTILVSVCIWMLSRVNGPMRLNSLLDVFRQQRARGI